MLISQVDLRLLPGGGGKRTSGGKMDYWPIYAAELVLWSLPPIPINGGVPLRMKCLSVRQPWAGAICSGEKRIENRTWSTNFRGTIAIHAGSSKAGINELRRRVKVGKLDESIFPLGAVVDVADIVDCLPLNEQLVEEDPWAQGPMCWILENARRLEKPIPMKGKLNLFSPGMSTPSRSENSTVASTPLRLTN